MARTPKNDMIGTLAAQVKERLDAQADAPDGSQNTDPSSLNPPTPESLADSIERQVLFDIFTHCEHTFIERGDGITYQINRNGAALDVKSHPYSWHELQKEFGGGRYHVVATSMTTGKIVKHQQRTLLDPPKTESAPAFEFGSPQPAQSSQSEILALMLQMNQQNAERDRQFREEQAAIRREEEEKRRASKADLMSTITTLAGVLAPVLMPLLKRPEKGIDPTLSLLLDNMKESNRTLADQFNRALDEMRRGATQKGPDPIEYLSKMQEAEDRGFKKALTMTEMVDEKAEIRAGEMMAGQGGQEDSVTTTMIKTLAPVLPQLFMAGKSGGTAPAAPPALRAVPSPSQQSGAPRQPNSPSAPRNPAQQNPQRPALSSPPRVTPGQSKVPSKVSSSGAKPVVVEKVASPVAAPVQSEKPVIEVNPSNPASEKPVENLIDPVFKKALVTQLTPFIAEALMKRQTPVDTADALIGLLSKQGVALERVIANVKLEDMHALAKENGLPEAVYPWFNDFYAHVEATARVDDRKPA